MKKQKWILWVGMLMLLAMGLSACGTTTPAAAETPAQENAVVEAEATPANTLVETPMAQDMAETALKPTPRAELEATDPNTVALASGSYQLIEFFAFW